MTDARSRLGGTVRSRRMALDLTQSEAARLAGISDSTWLAIEKGETVSERSIIGVERALRWEPGSAKSVMDGGEPTLSIVAEHEGDQTSEWWERLEQVERRLAEVREQMAADRALIEELEREKAERDRRRAG